MYRAIITYMYIMWLCGLDRRLEQVRPGRNETPTVAVLTCHKPPVKRRTCMVRGHY